MNQKGQGLIEALIALGAAVIIIAAMTIAVITALNNADFSSYQNLATNYAQQGIEIIQQKSQLAWTTIPVNQATYCLAQGATDLPPQAVFSCATINVDNKFVRQVTFTPKSGSCGGSTQVEVTVSWTDGKCSGAADYCHQVTLDSCLADIYRLVTPTPTP
jgi:Tfp pilus assembly protein PilV